MRDFDIEELLIRTDKLEKTANNLIFIDHDDPISKEALQEKLTMLQNACDSGDDDTVRDTLRQVVPTYRTPEAVNAEAAV